MNIVTKTLHILAAVFVVQVLQVLLYLMGWNWMIYWPLSILFGGCFLMVISSRRSHPLPFTRAAKDRLTLICAIASLPVKHRLTGNMHSLTLISSYQISP